MKLFQIKTNNETQKQHVVAVALAERYRDSYGGSLSATMEGFQGFDYIVFADGEKRRELVGANKIEKSRLGKLYTYEQFCEMGLDGIISDIQEFRSVDVAPGLKACFEADEKGFQLYYKGNLICARLQSQTILNAMVDKS